MQINWIPGFRYTTVTSLYTYFLLQDVEDLEAAVKDMTIDSSMEEVWTMITMCAMYSNVCNFRLKASPLLLQGMIIRCVIVIRYQGCNNILQ